MLKINSYFITIFERKIFFFFKRLYLCKRPNKGLNSVHPNLTHKMFRLDGPRLQIRELDPG